MDMEKGMKRTEICCNIGFVLFGLLLILWRTITFKLIGQILGGAGIVTGLIQIILYCTKEKKDALYSNNFAVGLILLAFGIVLLARVDSVMDLAPIVLGGCLFAGGAFQAQDAMDLKQMDDKKWGSILVFAVISVVLGGLMIGLPFESDEPLILFAGISFAAAGGLSLLGNLFVKKRAKAFLEAENRKGRKEGEISEEQEKTRKSVFWKERAASKKRLEAEEHTVTGEEVFAQNTAVTEERTQAAETTAAEENVLSANEVLTDCAITDDF